MPAFVRLKSGARFAIVHCASFVVVVALGRSAIAGPEIALREYAGGQVKKGVRMIGMGGDGATTGNYALVYRDAGGLAVTRTADVFGRHNTSLIGTLGFDDEGASKR